MGCSTPQRKALEAALATARATVATLEAALAAPDTNCDDPLRDLADVKVETDGVTAHTARTWIRSGRLEAHQAERGRYVFRQSALRKAIEQAPAPLRPPRLRAVNDLSDWESETDTEIAKLGRAGR